MTFQNKEIVSRIENGKKLEQNKLDFQNPDKLFSQLKNKDNISKDVFEKIFSDFETKTGKQGKEILENMSNFVDKNNLKDTESILSIQLFIEYAIDKFQDKSGKKIKILQEKNTVFLIKLINNFRDNAKDLAEKQLASKEKQQVSKEKQQASKEKQQASKEKQQVSKEKQQASKEKQ